MPETVMSIEDRARQRAAKKQTQQKAKQERRLKETADQENIPF
jgi:hypothetical protein